MREQASTPQGWACSMACTHVVGIQAAGDDDLLFEIRGSRPVPRFTAAARNAFDWRIDQHCLDLGAERLLVRLLGGKRLPDANAARLGRAMKLRYVEPGVEHDPGYGLWRFIDEHPDLPHARRDLLTDHSRASM